MGKKRVIKKTTEGGEKASGPVVRVSSRRKLTEGIVHILSTYNNTLITLTDSHGNVYLSQTSGRSGFSGSKKGTPYAASKAAEILSDQARLRTEQYQKKDIKILDIGNLKDILLKEKIKTQSLNVFFLGVLAKILIDKKICETSDIVAQLEKKLGKKLGWEENKKAFEFGLKYSS